MLLIALNIRRCMQLQAEGMLGYSAPSYRRLCEGAQQCLEAAHLQGKHPTLLQDWLSPAETLVQHGAKHDMDLVMDLQCSLFDTLEVGKRIKVSILTC